MSQGQKQRNEITFDNNPQKNSLIVASTIT